MNLKEKKSRTHYSLSLSIPNFKYSWFYKISMSSMFSNYVTENKNLQSLVNKNITRKIIFLFLDLINVE